MSSFVVSQLPNIPTNLILTGVAGTGKTHNLLHIQRLYDETVTLPTQHIVEQLLADIGWREVVCAVLLLENRAMRVAEIVGHALFQAKAAANGRSNNLAQTARGVLQPYSLSQHSTSQDSTTIDEHTINTSHDNASHDSVEPSNFLPASQCYFAQSSDKSWYLLDEVKPTLAKSLNDVRALAQTLGIQLPSNSPNSPTSPHECVPTDKLNQATHVNDELTATHLLVASSTNSMSSTHTLSRSTFVSFHQAYGYDEFVEGIRPQLDEQSGQMRYRIVAGAFLELCQRAMADPKHRYAMLIDEMNRANVVQVFGELMSVIEADKRAGASNALSVKLAYSGRTFSVPSNVDIYATMNTQDHSLVRLDMAFRRRFEFVELHPDTSMLTSVSDALGACVNLQQLLGALNTRISQHLGTQALLGQAFLCTVNDMSDLARVMARQILPQLIATIETHAIMGQTATMMADILYGTATELEHPLLQTIHSAEGARLQITPELAQAANSDSLQNYADKQADRQLGKTSASLTINPYLTAAPYQQIYRHAAP